MRALRLVAGAALALSGGSAAAQTMVAPRGADRAPEAVRGALGAWDLQLAGAPRLCTITLGIEEVSGGRQLRFPATCRRALPVLAQVSSWSLDAAGQPRLNNAAGTALISFGQAGARGVLRGRGSDGQDYDLDPKAYPRLVRRAAPSANELAARETQRRTVVQPANMPAPETLPGRYVVMRQQNREACRLTLTAGTAAGANAPAAFEGSCSDTGLTIFDPAGWRYAAGRLTLIARKGHSIELVLENGQWRRDPPLGAPLLLRKLAP